MRGAIDVRARSMDRRVYHESCDIEALHRARLRQNIAFVVDKNEVLGLNEREVDALATIER